MSIFEKIISSASTSFFSRPSAENTKREQPKIEKLSLKKKGIGSEVRAQRMANADSDLQLLGDAERARQLQKLKKRRLQGREDEVCSNLQYFFVLIPILFLYLKRKFHFV